MATTPRSRKFFARRSTGSTGPLYQGRFKAFPVQEDDHYFSVTRYVERNALRANLVARAEDWRWCRIGRDADAELRSKLSAGPLALPPHWLTLVNRPQTEAELTALRRSVSRSRPYGSESWTSSTAKSLGLDSTLRPRGRPRLDEDSNRG
jgi:putative transposase